MKKKSDEEQIEDFFDRGRFLDGTIFCRSYRTDSLGHERYWFYKCPVCSFDQISSPNPSENVFEIHRGDALKGKLSCRCSKWYRWSEAELKTKIVDRILVESLPYQFLGWKNGEFKGVQGKMLYFCEKHGNHEVQVRSFLAGVSCPNCSLSGKKELYVNMVYDKSGNELGIKIGISYSSEDRLKSLSSTSGLPLKNLTKFVFEEDETCSLAESLCKDLVPKGYIAREIFGKGWTETTTVDNIQKIKDICASLGGKEVE